MNYQMKSRRRPTAYRDPPEEPVSVSFVLALAVQTHPRVPIGLIESMRTFDVFEACARREITPEEGAFLLGLKRVVEPWPIRLMRWIFE